MMIAPDPHAGSFLQVVAATMIHPQQDPSGATAILRLTEVPHSLSFALTFARQTQQQQTEATVPGGKPLIINKSNQQDLDSSTRTQMSNVSTKWVCSHCQKRCKSERGLEQHTLRVKECREAERAAGLCHRIPNQQRED